MIISLNLLMNSPFTYIIMITEKCGFLTVKRKKMNIR